VTNLPEEVLFNILGTDVVTKIRNRADGTCLKR